MPAIRTTSAAALRAHALGANGGTSPAWSQQAYLKASNAEAGDRFGTSVALSGNTLVVGAYLEDSKQTAITNGSTAWREKSTPRGPSGDAVFGHHASRRQMALPHIGWPESEAIAHLQWRLAQTSPSKAVKVSDPGNPGWYRE